MKLWLFLDDTLACLSFMAAVQNERQPRSTALVCPDSLSVDARKECLATTEEFTSASNATAICRSLVTSSATTQPCSNVNNSHRFMVSLQIPDTSAKLKLEDGKSLWQKLNRIYFLGKCSLLWCLLPQLQSFRFVMRHWNNIVEPVA